MSLPPSPGSRPTPKTQDGLTDPEGADGVVVEVVEQTPDPLRVLLIEDNPDHAALVEAYLADVHDPVIRLDHVTTVEAGTAALDAAGAAADPFHVVLADQQLPDSQYWETVARVVAVAGAVPVVALTSLGDLEVALDAVRSGASDYLVKAELTPEVLRRTLRYAVERARRDRALRDSNEALRQTLRHVRQMQAQIVEQEKLAGLGRLLAGVAHELRNPLGLAVGFAEAAVVEAAALAETAELTGEAAAHLRALSEAADGAARQGRRADEVVRSMYEHARGVDGVLRPVALAEVVRSAVAQASAGDVEVSVDVVPGVEVVGVGSALARMLSNLIGNAVLAARSGGGHVAVTAEAGGGDVVLTVADDGPGIDPATLATAFEPFTSGWASGRRVGLGLSLARAIAVSHGGRIELGPGSLGGAAVRVTLPGDVAAKPAG